MQLRLHGSLLLMIEMENFTYLLPIKVNRGLSLLLLCLFMCSDLAAQNQPLLLSANAMESACAGEGHVISVKATGGKNPYTYRWQDGKEGDFRKDLPSGTYVCVVEDAEGHTVSKEFNFAPQAALLELEYSQQEEASGLHSISLQAKGGRAPYTFIWVGSGVDMKEAQNKKGLTQLKAGIYQAVVQDANECTASVTINIK